MAITFRSERPKSATRSRLNLERLDSREVPATFNSATGEVLIDHSGDRPSIAWNIDVRYTSVVDHTAPDALTITERSVETRSDGSSISTRNDFSFALADVRSLRIRTGWGADEIALYAIPSSIPVSVAGGGGTNRLTVGAGNNNWAMTARTGGTVNGFIQYSQIDRFAAGNGFDTIDLSGWTTGATVSLSDFTNFDRVLGGSGVDTLAGSGTWILNGTNAGTVGNVAFSGIENLTSSGSSTFVFVPGCSVTGTVGGQWMTFDYSAYSTAVSVDLIARRATGIGVLGKGLDEVIGGSAADSLTAAGDWWVTGMDSGDVYDKIYKPDQYVPFLGLWPTGPISFESMENLKAGSGNDRFTIETGGSVSSRISASDGVDTLDYADWTSSVTVNLGYGTAPNVARIDGFEMVLGGSAADTLVGSGRDEVLVGNGGNDRLEGNGGRDILIGGVGADSLFGGIGDDVLIAGSTIFDDWRDSLAYLRSDWIRPDRTYSERCDLLAASLTATTVTHDTEVDQLTGGADRDWFWARYSPLRTLFPMANQDSLTDWVGIAPIDSNTLERLG